MSKCFFGIPERVNIVPIKDTSNEPMAVGLVAPEFVSSCINYMVSTRLNIKL